MAATSPTSVAAAGQARGHGLDERKRHLLGIGRQREHVQRAIERVWIVEPAHEFDPIRHAEFTGEPLQRLALGTVARDHQARRGRIRHHPERAQQPRQVLLRAQRRYRTDHGLRAAMVRTGEAVQVDAVRLYSAPGWGPAARLRSRSAAACARAPPRRCAPAAPGAPMPAS
jgi:hypothetical protein